MYKNLFFIALILIALLSAAESRRKGYHREGEHKEGENREGQHKGGEHKEGEHKEGEHGEGKEHHGEKWKRCMYTNSIGQTFNLNPLRKLNAVTPISDGMITVAICGRLHLSNCSSAKSCYSNEGIVINAGQDRQWIDTQTNDSVSFQYVNGDACGNEGSHWSTIFEIQYLPSAGTFDLSEVIYDGCTVKVRGSSSQILSDENDCDGKDGHGGKPKKHGKSGPVMFWVPIVGGSLAALCCICLCCCAVRRMRACKRQCRWNMCKSTNSSTNSFSPLPENPSEAPVPIQYEVVTPPPMPQSQYPHLSFPMQFYPTTYFPPQMMPGTVPPTVPLMSVNVDPREAQIEMDEKLARSIQEQLH